MWSHKIRIERKFSLSLLFVVGMQWYWLQSIDHHNPESAIRALKAPKAQALSGKEGLFVPGKRKAREARAPAKSGS
jgi:hypothetical protein